MKNNTLEALITPSLYYTFDELVGWEVMMVWGYSVADQLEGY